MNSTKKIMQILVYNLPWSIVIRITAESDFKGLQKLVHSDQKSHGWIGQSFDTRLTFKHNDHIGQVSSHDEIVLHDEGSLLSVENVSEIWIQEKNQTIFVAYESYMTSLCQ